MLEILPVQDSRKHAEHCKQLLARSSFSLIQIAQQTQKIVANKRYSFQNQEIDISQQLEENLRQKRSISPEENLILPSSPQFTKTKVQICNETTLMTARRFTEQHQKVLVLNFANGTNVGGGYLVGARAQEETLCYASSLYQTLKGDPFYRYHRFKRIKASDYAIVSRAAVFRDDKYELISTPWQMDVITAAAPIAAFGIGVSKEEGAALMNSRIARVYEIAASLGYHNLILGAWGCGAFGNDPVAIAHIFRKHLEHRFDGWFSEVVFTIADWSPERRFLRPFADCFAE